VGDTQTTIVQMGTWNALDLLTGVNWQHWQASIPKLSTAGKKVELDDTQFGHRTKRVSEDNVSQILRL
jgi:hypothetical protein